MNLIVSVRGLFSPFIRLRDLPSVFAVTVKAYRTPRLDNTEYVVTHFRKSRCSLDEQVTFLLHFYFSGFEGWSMPKFFRFWQKIVILFCFSFGLFLWFGHLIWVQNGLMNFAFIWM